MPVPGIQAPRLRSSAAVERDARKGGGETARLQGAIERVTYTDAATGYSVLRIAPEKGYEPPADASLFRATRVSAVGRADGPVAGLRVRLAGRWNTSSAHGLQFEFEDLEVLPPDDRAGLVKYLASDRFPGIGEKLAERIVDQLGLGAIDEILAHPEKLAEVRGLHAHVRDALVQAALVEHGTARVTSFLRTLGLGPMQAAAVIKKLGPGCEERLRADPYLLASGVPGFGFASAPIDPVWAYHHPKRAALVSAAGPIANFLLAAIAFAVLYILARPESDEGRAVRRIAGTFLMLNVLLGIFNLFPVPPLDGAGVLAGLFKPVRTLFGRLDAVPYLKLILVFAVAFNLVEKVFWPVYDSITRLLPYPI